MATTKVVLTDFGTHTYVVPDGVYHLKVTCTGKNGTQTVDDIEVTPGQEISYYIESSDITDDTSDVTYFGPYLCAYSSGLGPETASQGIQAAIEIEFINA